MVATADVLLLHVPPLNTSVYAALEPEHSEVDPDIAGGVGFTVSVAVAEQPPAR